MGDTPEYTRSALVALVLRANSLNMLKAAPYLTYGGAAISFLGSAANSDATWVFGMFTLIGGGVLSVAAVILTLVAVALWARWETRDG